MAEHMTAEQVRAEFEAFMKRRGTPLILEQTQAFESFRAGIECAVRIYGATPALTRDAIADLVEGMSVSVDVSTREDDAGHRYFGTVTEAMHDPDDKHGLTLLVQNAEPNFDAARLSGMAAGWQPIETAPKRTRVIVGYHNSQGKWRTAMATYFTEDDIADWENDDCSPGWYERSYAHEAENEYVYALEAGPRCWQSLPPEPPHV